jgi:hypothetical protein
MSTLHTPPGGFPPQPPQLRPQEPESFFRRYRLLFVILGLVLGFGLGSVAVASALANNATSAVSQLPVADNGSAAPVPDTTPSESPLPAASPSGTSNGTTINGPVTIITTAPSAGSTVYVPVPASAPYYVTTNQGVVQQYYDYINAKNFSAAWDMGGQYIGGSDYNAWAAGYSTTSYVALSTWDYYPGYNAVGVTISATQSDGSVRTYAGSYTVSGGVITSASIKQISGGSGSSNVAAPPGLRYVGNGVYANSNTSSAFALAVKQAYEDGGYWNQAGTSQFYVHSPTTGKTYLMTSSSAGNPVVVTGGTNVLVEFDH